MKDVRATKYLAVQENQQVLSVGQDQVAVVVV